MTLKIVCDIDSVVAQFLEKHLAVHAKATGEVFSVDEISAWDMRKISKFPDKILTYFNEPGFYEDLEPIPGALDALEYLKREEGHRVVVATHATTPHGAAEKLVWCAKHLPFLDPKSIWIGGNKHDIGGDVFIDDGPHNAVAYRKEHPDALILTVGYAYNAGCPAYDHICGSSEDYFGAWSEILGHIERRRQILQTRLDSGVSQ